MSQIPIDKKRSFLFSALFLVSLFNGSPSVHHTDISSYSIAYLDPGTGTMIISAIVGIGATIALGVKTFWYRITRLFKSGNKKASAKND
jgi:hypothetical protein